MLWSPVPVLSWVALTLMIGISGPYGSYENIELGMRLAMWAVFNLGAILLGVAVRLAMWRVLHRYSYWTVSVLTSAVLALSLAGPMKFFVIYLSHETHQRVPSLLEIVMMLFSVGLGLSSLRILLDKPPRPTEAPVLPPRLIRRLPPGMQGPVIRCAVSDHYVLVVTERGEDKLLMRFSDAISELEGVDGLRVHRSHWVAMGAVTGHANENGRLFLLAKDGARIPVSRNYRPAVEARLSA